MKAIIILISIALLSFIGTNEKTYKVELKMNDWVKYSNGLETVKAYLNQSDLPARTVKELTDSIINPLKREIVNQVSKQAKDSTK